MRDLVKSWFKYFLVICFFGVCVNVLYLAVPVYVMVVYDKALFSFSLATLSTLSAGMLISLLLMGVMDYLKSCVMVQAANDFSLKFSAFAFKHMHENRARGLNPVYSRGIDDLAKVRTALAQGHLVRWLDLPWVLIYLGILYGMNATLGIVAIVCAFIAWVARIFLGILGDKRYTAADVILDMENQRLNASLRNSETIWGMGMLPQLLDRFDASFNRYIRLLTQADYFQSLVGAFVRVLCVLSPMAVFAVGVYLYFQNKMTIGLLFAGVMVGVRVFWGLGFDSHSLKQGIEAAAALKRLKHFVKTAMPAEAMDLPSPEGRLTLEGVSLRLGDRMVLNNINLDLAPGQTLGVIGAMASGKTSLCKTMLGIWSPLAGKVRLDGAEIGQWPRKDLGQYLGYLPEEPELFSGTVAENIARMEKGDPKKIIASCQKAGIHEMILKLPNGYDTRIDQTGKNLSAGQRKLIALARALYNDPKLIVMDDPQNCLDDAGMALLLKVMATLKSEKITLVLVTDRTNLLMQSDQALVIKEGQVAMYGPSKEVFTQLANQQKVQ